LWLTSTLFFLRRSPSPLHDDSMMQHLTDALLDTFETLSIPLGAATQQMRQSDHPPPT